MQTLQWVQTQLPFLQTEYFTFLYGWLVFLNPLALMPQLISSIRSKAIELQGVSVSMFVIFLIIQMTVALGAVNSMDVNLFWSMSISAVETFLIIVITQIRRCTR